jgi:hypothetical protein
MKMRRKMIWMRKIMKRKYLRDFRFHSTTEGPKKKIWSKQLSERDSGWIQLKEFVILLF